MSLLDWIWPKFCVGCGCRSCYLCANCLLLLGQKDLICPICWKLSLGGQTHPLCFRPWGLDGLWSFGAYQGALKKLIQKLKFRWVKGIAIELVDQLIIYWVWYLPLLIEQIKLDPGSWVIVPVPLHPKRLSQRGFNQSALIGQLLSSRLGLSYRELLIKIKDTQSQVEFNAQKRRNNPKGAFTARNLIMPANVILIDDVWTTGSTLKECCKVLKQAGVKKVWALTIAR